jgi:hypothetical protein
MMEDEKLNEFYCIFSEQKHFLIDPVTISCGHSICKKCLPRENTTSIRCKICKRLVSYDANRIKVSRGFKEVLKCFKNEIFTVIEKEMCSKLNDLKSFI